MNAEKLQSTPSQSLIVTRGGVRWEITFKDAGGFMVYGIIKDGVEIIAVGMRIVNDQPLIPYEYLESGNFVLDVPEDETPNYKSFGITQVLYYITAEELAELR